MSSRLQEFLLSVLQDRSRNQYKEALLAFRADLDRRAVSWVSLPAADRDDWLAEYILEAKEGGQSRQRMQILCAALHKISPRDSYILAKRVLEAWKHQEPVKQAPACPQEVAYALVAAALLAHQPGVAVCIFLCFTGLLRVSEALQLRWHDVVFTGRSAVLVLGRTKRGLHDKVVLTHPGAISWLQKFRQVFRANVGDRVANISYSKFRYWMAKLTAMLHLSHMALTSHSFRRGGASTLLQLGLPLADIAVQGRWASESSCRDYLRGGDLLLLRHRAQSAHAWTGKLEVLAGSLFTILQMLAVQHEA